MSFGASFPHECLEDIFHHLRGRDLIKCTLVCPYWNEFMKSTLPCLKKIRFRFCNIDWRQTHSPEQFMWFLRRKWKQVTAYQRTFHDPKIVDESQMFLRKMQNTVKDLRIYLKLPDREEKSKYTRFDKIFS